MSDSAADQPPSSSTSAHTGQRADSLDLYPTFGAAPRMAKAWLMLSLSAAIALPILVGIGQGLVFAPADLLVAVLLLLASVCNVELGRILDRAAREQQRPHKGLSAWAIAAAILLPSWYLLLVIGLTYWHAWLRDQYIPIWKWVGSAAYMTMASLCAREFLQLAAFDVGLDSSVTGGGVAMVIGSCLVFMVVESSLLAVFVIVNGANGDIWLRRTLVDPLFYATEFGVLTLGAMTGLVAQVGGWFVLLLGPSFLLMQQAVLHRPLQQRADYDDKTGVLQFRSWQRAAQDVVAGLIADRRPWAVLFADLDRFHAFNERHGHLGGDRALAQTATAIENSIGRGAVVGRFGGEEFCMLITDVSSASALKAAERVRVAIASLGPPLVAGHITISVGVAAIPGFRTEISISEAISLADEALYDAKQSGRNTVRLARPM